MVNSSTGVVQAAVKKGKKAKKYAKSHISKVNWWLLSPMANRVFKIEAVKRQNGKIVAYKEAKSFRMTDPRWSVKEVKHNSYKIGKSKAATKAIYKKLVYKYAKVRPSDQEVDQILIFEK